MPVGGEEFEQKALNENKRRKFLNEMRPHNDIWNFFEDGEDGRKVSHLLRFDANPMKCYKDGRVEAILGLIEEIGTSLKRYEE
jgi:hypothetical protein